MEVAEMLSALRSTLEDPSGAATHLRSCTGAFRARDATSAPCRGAPVPAYVGCVIGCVSDSGCNQVP